ncbi:uncharacterized protein LOC127249993 [Andrographis paniculata]|uniref:uncharacterized protein LOC127249993 n=1 Tax=Andrographis paniculata TaxID=175694 RepID=UPI0021E71B19|nr:uncharacterized protein LOC127249993 [Andrographis paniculata]XP_051129079.1 uncharacterized protein LOC127249993 [Andrographis paniculata]XP_051129080.1 uncharacterized protein LOC127249993 [Andrographis paniculata]
MEKRQLDFNAPILSARRYSSPSRSTELVPRKAPEKANPDRQQSLPANKFGWENEEVTKPAAVPFHWEQIPGRPKDELSSQAPTPEETPRLPPARVSDAIRRNSGESPRLPSGRGSGQSRYNSGERSVDHNVQKSQVESFSYADHAMLLEKLNESLNCKDESDSESEDDAYSDALDTLSVGESHSVNYSVSGLSGYHSSGVKPAGTFCVDEQTRDLMMNRFLPAAKAAVVETPQYVAKKSQVANVETKVVRKAVSGEITKPLSKENVSNTLPYYSQYIDYTESEDDDQDHKIPVKKPGKVWGILPRFCVKNSLCLLNPLPVMKSRPRPPTPPTPHVHDVRRLSRKALSGPLDKNVYHVPNKKKFHSGMLVRELPGVEGNLHSDDPSQFVSPRDSVRLSVSPLRRYRSGNISPYRNETPKSPFRDGAGLLGLPKEADNQLAYKIASSRKMLKALQDVSRNQTTERRSSAPNGDAVEKTVYVDFVNKTEHRRITKPSGERIKPQPNIFDLRKKPSLKNGPECKVLPDVKVDPNLCPEFGPLEWIPDVKLGSKEERKVESEKKESDHQLLSPLPPPLPKSPSESWLWRTLPSISNPFAHSRQRSRLHPKKAGAKGSADAAKWETIVKTSNLRQDHIRYSEELHRQSK